MLSPRLTSLLTSCLVLLLQLIRKDFTAYADVCFREFGDRVKHWTTVNEGNMCSMMGYDVGAVQPQRCSPSSIFNCSKGNSSTEPYLVTHHMLLAHASAANLYRNKYLNPFIFGDYPAIMKKNVGSRLPFFTSTESNLVKGSIDFIGINFYYAFHVKNSPGSLQIKNRDFVADMGVELIYIPQNISLHEEIPITPWILERMLHSLKKEYGNFPIYIHENGQLLPSKSLDDRPRVEYIREYIGSLPNMLRNGLDIRGYFVWSFLDVFELQSGYEASFGLYYIDFQDPTLRRQPKLSALWYSNFLNNKTAMKIEENSSLLSNTPHIAT
ncbi:hypothetical protein RYX36_011885 [Vicia faba]